MVFVLGCGTLAPPHQRWQSGMPPIPTSAPGSIRPPRSCYSGRTVRMTSRAALRIFHGTTTNRTIRRLSRIGTAPGEALAGAVVVVRGVGHGLDVPVDGCPALVLNALFRRQGGRRARPVPRQRLGVPEEQSPTLFATDRTDRMTYIAQGWKVTDPQALADVGDAPDHETLRPARTSGT